ncbi:MAG: flagellar protein FlaG [Chitinispirillia bacterium]|nr:flagellar protein FlaG [Chitinispirillia bacterium]MCL2268245.1 flagellar protein FlaG [Chitinispirillia bacterium]
MTVTNVGSVATMAPVYTGGETVTTAAPVNNAPAQAAPAPAPAPVSIHASASPELQNAIVLPGAGSKAAMEDAELEKIMEEPIKQANKALEPFHRQIEREIHNVTKALMYTIRDTETKEVIAEYPPRKIQDMIAKMWELAGLFIDQKA